MTNSVWSGALERDNAKLLNPPTYAGRGGDVGDNLQRAAEYAEPTRQAELVTLKGEHRDNWNATLSAINRRTIALKSGGWQRVFDGQEGHA